MRELYSYRLLSKQFIINAFFGFAGYLVFYVFNIYLARILGPVGFGDFNVAMFVAVMCGQVINLGSSLSFNKFYAQCEAEGNVGGILPYYNFFGLRLTVISVIFLVILLIIVYSYYYILHENVFVNPHPFFFATLLSPFFSFQNLTLCFYSCLGWPVLAVLNKRFLSIILPMLFVYITGFFIKTISSNLVIGIFLFSLVIICLATFFFLKYIANVSFKRGGNRYKRKEWLSVSIPAMLSDLILVATSQVGLIMIEILGSREDGVGFYSAAISLASIFIVVGHSVSFVLNPLIVRSLEDQSVSKRHVFLFSVAFIIPSIILLGGGIIVFAKPILSTFGPGFAESSYLLVVIVLSRSFDFISLPARFFLMFDGKQRYIIATYIFYFVSIILLSLWLIPMYQECGAAMSLLISSIFSSFIMNGLFIYYYI